MDGAVILLLIAAALALLALAAWLLEWRPIGDWSNFNKRWSTWLHASGLLSLGAYLGIWNMMPVAVQRLIPGGVFLAVGVVLWVAAALATYVRQEALDGV